MFFEDHPEFHETSGIKSDRMADDSPSPRLGNRYRGIVLENISLFKDATVLDIGCHNGRWSMAALHAGAKYVTGIEGRKEAVENARRIFAGQKWVKGNYSFLFGEAFELLNNFAWPFDLVLCLGFMYHTPHHVKLFEHFHRLGKTVILDTKTVKYNKPVTSYMTESVTSPGCALPTFGKTAVVGVPSRNVIYYLAEHFKFDCTEVNWRSVGITDWTNCLDYYGGSRRTYVLRSKA